MAGNIFVIDYQAFRSPTGHVYFKELVCVGVDTNYVYHAIITPPAQFYTLSNDFKRHVKYVMDHIHGISWDVGFIDENSAWKIIIASLEKADRVYIKGADRVQHIKHLLLLQKMRNIDVIDLNIVKLFGVYNTGKRITYDKCDCHHLNMRCSLEQGTRYRDIIRRILFNNIN